MADALKKINASIRRGPFKANWKSLEQFRVPAWYEDAKFGIFIHWGVYAVPAFGNEWYPRNMYVAGSKENEHHLANFGPLDKFGYKDFVPHFKAEKFDPEAWADLFRQAGAKFVMPVAEHHDGFAMYDSAFTDWSAAKRGPRRDVVGDLATAVRRRDMRFAVSNHRAENYWYFGEGMNLPSDVRDDANAGLYGSRRPKPKDHHDADDAQGPPKLHLDDWLVRCCELVDKYEPSVVWFDWWIKHRGFAKHLQKFAAYYYNRSTDWPDGGAINYKYDAFPPGTAVFDVERGQMRDIQPRLWQTDTSVSKTSWCYVHEQSYKSPTAIIHDLIDIVSKNGCLLLNIGPRPNGTIAPAEVRILTEIGQWLSLNGEAIFGTRPWKTFGEGPTQVVEGAFTDTRRPAFTPSDWRFTTRGGAVYAIRLSDVAQRRSRIASLGKNLRLLIDPIRNVELVGSDQPVKWSQTADGLDIDLPSQAGRAHALALRITTA